MQLKRNLSLDLLRIIAMLMVIILHLLGKGSALNSNIVMINNISWLLESFCIVAVNIFVLISGYFLYDSKFSWKKVINLWSSVLFYSIIFLILFLFIGQDVSKHEILFSILPIITKQNYWFVTCYILMYIFSPFLNFCISKINKIQHFGLSLILFVVFVVLGLILPPESLLDSTGGYGIVWFVILYIYATYLRKYNTKKGKNNIIYIFMYIIFCVCNFLLYLFFKKYNILYCDRLYWYNSILVLFSSISIFLFFKNININSKIINRLIYFISPLTFGVYLIHENIFVRKVLYNNFFHVAKYGDYGLLIFLLIVLLEAILIFIVCILIEYLRKKLFILIHKICFLKKIDEKICSLVKVIDKLIIRRFKLNED